MQFVAKPTEFNIDTDGSISDQILTAENVSVVAITPGDIVTTGAEDIMSELDKTVRSYIEVRKSVMGNTKMCLSQP